MSNINPWQFTSPYIPYTVIRAEEVNPNFGGIAATLKLVTDELNQYVPRLPDGFTGNVKAPPTNPNNTLLHIDGDGDFQLLPLATFMLGIGKDLTPIETSDSNIEVDGDNHGNWFICDHEGATSEDYITVLVKPATGTVDGEFGEAPGTIVLFTQDTDTSIQFVEAPSVSVITPGLMRPHGKGSTVALMAVSLNKWVLVGDVALGEEIVSEPD